jgi:epoxide hydrolase-like predicted phosphatase
MIRAIIFDSFGVLTDQVFGFLIKDLSPQSTEKVNAINELADLGQISGQQRIQRTAQFIDGGLATIESYYRQVRINDELLDLILELRKKYKIGLLSNTSDNDVERFFSPADMAKYFDDVILSYRVQLTKPHPEIYQLAAQRLNVTPAECVFIDDNAHNIAGAEAVGMRGILYQDFSQFKKDLDKVLEQKNAGTTRG